MLQQFALTESGSALQSEACDAAGASDAVVHSRVYHEVLRSRAKPIIVVIIIIIIIITIILD